jgi:hypothetical protein
MRDEMVEKIFNQLHGINKSLKLISTALYNGENRVSGEYEPTHDTLGFSVADTLHDIWGILSDGKGGRKI